MKNFRQMSVLSRLTGTSDQTYVTDGTLKLYHNFVPDTTVYYKVILIKDQK